MNNAAIVPDEHIVSILIWYVFRQPGSFTLLQMCNIYMVSILNKLAAFWIDASFS